MEASGGWVWGRRLVLSRTSARPGPEYSISTGPIGGDCHRPRARWQAPPASPPAVGQAGPVARSHQGPPTGGAPLSRPSRQSQERRGPGRPRSAEAHAAILAATLHLLIEQGFNGLTMEAVAARAGVGKATVYRRWPSKVPLVVEALRAAGEERVAVPASGSVEADLHQLLTDLIRAVSGPDSVLRPLVTEAWREPQLGEAFRQELVQHRRSVVRDVLEQGQRRGELRGDLDLETAVDAVVAVVYYRLLVSGAPLGTDVARCLVDQLLRGMRPRAGPHAGC